LQLKAEQGDDRDLTAKKAPIKDDRTRNGSAIKLNEIGSDEALGRPENHTVTSQLGHFRKRSFKHQFRRAG